MEARGHLDGESRQDEAHNCKAVLEKSSYRPLGDTEPQPTFAKTSVARDQKSTQGSHVKHAVAKFLQDSGLEHLLGRSKTFQANPSKGHFRQSGQNPRHNEIFLPKVAIHEARLHQISAKPEF